VASVDQPVRKPGSDPAVRQSVSLPSRIAKRVRALAETRHTTASRVLVDLIETGLQTKQAQHDRFFELTDRLAETTDPAERKRLAVEEANSRYKTNAFEPATGKLYTDFVADLSARGITPIGIKMPESGEYRAASRELIDPAAERFIASLGIQILDYRDMFVDRPDLFTDPDHLSDEGARLLSVKVAEDVRRIVGLSPQPAWNCASSRPLLAGVWPFQLVLSRALGLTTK